MTKAQLRERILAKIPTDRFVAANDVVRSLEPVPSKAVWAQIVVLAMEGLITADRPGVYNGYAMVRRQVEASAR